MTTRVYALIGKPISHSLSADYFNALFQSQEIDAEYRLKELDHIDQVRPWLQANPQIVGFNVTSPYKQQIIPLLDYVDYDAHYVGAVNTVVVERTNGSIKLKGYNTDIEGVVESLKPHLTSDLQHALVLGSGGAALAVSQALKILGRDATLVSRSPKRDHILSYTEVTADLIANTGIIINATPVGMGSLIGQRPTIPYEALTPQHLCMDLIYNPEETAFLLAAKSQGAVALNGLKMLLVQARYAWHIWKRHQ